MGSRRENLERRIFKPEGRTEKCRTGRQDGERSELTTHDSLMGTKMKSFWNRSTCRVHVFTLLCFLFWILPMENHRIKHPNGTTRRRRDL